jgi:ClpP class serine protease
MKNTILRILTMKGHEKEKAERIADLLTSGYWTHDYPLTVEVIKELGLSVSTEVPDEVYELMELYYQPVGQPSVQYVPVPYGEPKKGEVPVRKPH